MKEETERKKIGVLDLGVKNSTLDYLAEKGFTVTVFPYNTKAEDILNSGVQALFVSNEPEILLTLQKQ